MRRSAPSRRNPKARARKRRKKPRRSATEYFLAATGLALVAFVVALALSYRSCDFTLPAAAPGPTTTPAPTSP